MRRVRTRATDLVVERADPLAESWFESVSRWWLQEAGLPRPRLQVPFTDTRAAFGREWTCSSAGSSARRTVPGST
jgi:hypothetical protein